MEGMAQGTAQDNGAGRQLSSRAEVHEVGEFTTFLSI